MTAVRLGDLVDLDVGFAFKSSGFVDAPDGVRLLRGDNVSLGRLRWHAPKYWPASDLQGLERYVLALGDVVVAMDRPWIGGGLKQAVVRFDDVPALLVQRVARLRARPGLDQGFLAAVVASRGFEDHILAMITGSAVPHISGPQILSFPVRRLPAVQEQRSIAAPLRALDDKIGSNRRVVLAAVQLAQFLLLGDGQAVRLGDVATLDKGVSYKGAGLEDEQSARARPLVNLGNFPVGSGWMNRSKTKYYSGDYRARHVVGPDAATGSARTRRSCSPGLGAIAVLAPRLRGAFSRSRRPAPCAVGTTRNAGRPRPLDRLRHRNDGRRAAERRVARLPDHGACFEPGRCRSASASRSGLGA